MTFRQARYDEPLLWEVRDPVDERPGVPALPGVPVGLLRKHPVAWPELSELELARHFTRLSQMNFGIETAFYPLGSCTMKYNPRVAELLSRREALLGAHPAQPEETVQGLLELLYELEGA
ncbi:glycine dehydrogenase subunit 2, partial [mine drainage metagenome]